MLPGGVDEEVDLMADLMCNFKTLNIPIDECIIEEFMHIDDENNEMFSQVISDDVNEMLETMQTRAETMEDESDHAIVETCTPFPEPTKDKVNFCEFQNMYEKVLEVEDQMLCPDLQAHEGDEYNKVKYAF